MSDDRPLDVSALIRKFQLDPEALASAIEGVLGSPVSPPSLIIGRTTTRWKATDLGRPAATPPPIHLISPRALDHQKSIADADLRFQGFVDKDRNLRNSDGKVKGSIDRLGNLVDNDGRVRGSVDKFGNVRDSDGRLGGGFDRCGNFRA